MIKGKTNSMKDISSLYLHFPFCRHLCNYCDFFKHVLENETQVTRYEEILTKQWEKHEDFLKSKHFKLGELETIYIGGGTPSLWGVAGVSYLQDLIKKKQLILASSCEFTLEVDPDAWSEDELERWFDLGVNRVSIGAQSFDDFFLEILDRQHRKVDIEKLLTYLKAKKINFSVDFLIGVPESDQRDIEQELKELLTFNPSHMSVYILKTRKNYPHITRLPDEETIADEYLKVCEYLNSSDLKQYEVSNFSKPGFESKHNFKYWQYDSVAAIGANGTGLLVYPEKAIRYQWKSSGAELKEDEISGTSLIIEKLFLQFRTAAGVEIDKIFEDEGAKAILDNLYDQWDQKRYLSPNSTRKLIKLSSQGYLMCDSILDDIFREIDF